MGVSPSKKSRISQASQRAQPDAASGIPDVAASPGMQLLDLFLGAAWGSQPGMTYYDHIISSTKVTRVGVQVNKCSRKGHACAKPIKLFRAKRTLTLSAHPQRRKVGEKNIPPEIKNKANYIISKFWIKFQCADPLQQKRRITIAPLRFQVIKIQIIQPLHVILHLAVG